MLLLCAGVLLAGLTYRSAADSYDVNAIVAAALPTSPAVITDPVDQTHFTTTPITVTGSCQQNSYVKLDRNGVFSGSAVCGSGQTSFQITTDLSPGSNTLLPQIYNLTDQAGPPSTPITVWYDQPAQPPAPVPSAPPTGLQVTFQDNAPFHQNVVAYVSPYVTERGTAPPYSHIVVTFHSAPVTCITDADGNGNWSCTLDQALPEGSHTVNVTATTPQGVVLTLPGFHVYVLAARKPLQVPRVIAPFLIAADFHYHSYVSGKPFTLSLGLAGGKRPYAVTIEWGDGTQSIIARDNSSSFSAKHTYILSGRNQRIYLVKVKVVDGNGATTFLEIAEPVHISGALVNGAPIVSGTGSNGNSPSSWRQWLAFAWPTYGVVLLMVFCFWLGERQEYHTLFTRKPKRRRHA